MSGPAAGRLSLDFPTTSSRLSSARRREIARVLVDSLSEGFPAGASLSVVDRSGVLLRAWGGLATRVPHDEAIEADTLYDLASLTKVVVTTTLALWLEQEGRWRLSDRVSRWLEDFEPVELTLRQLLTHTSGIIAHRPFFELGRRPAAIRRAVFTEARKARPDGTVLYSDLNFMLAGWALETCAGEPLDQLFARVVSEPLGMKDTRFRPGTRLRPRCAATELDGDQRLVPGLVRGEVHDGNAWALGGVAGHAGLFSTADDLSLFVGELLDPRRHHVLTPTTLRRMTRPQAGAQPDLRATAWRLEPQGWGPWPAGTIWHTGFTGTSLLVSPGADLAVVLLANAIHPTRELDRQAHYRARVHRVLSKVIS